MDKYYYLVAQLPYLVFGKKPEINKGQFLAEANKWLCANDMAILLKADINDFYVRGRLPKILEEYKIFERRLRSELAYWRALEKDGKEYKKTQDLYVESKEDSPLDAEKKLLLLRWNKVEEEEIGHFFDISFLIAYFLKLQILERLFTFNKQKGEERFESLCNGLLKKMALLHNSAGV